MSKKVEEQLCLVCESQYKLAYTPEDVSGFPKFCPFCGEELDFPDDEEVADEE